MLDVKHETLGTKHVDDALNNNTVWINTRQKVKNAVVITGGTGALGKLFTKFILNHYADVTIISLSRSGKTTINDPKLFL